MSVLILSSYLECEEISRSEINVTSFLPSSARLYDFEIDSKGNYIVSGFKFVYDAKEKFNKSVWFVIKFNSDFEESWSKTFKDNQTEIKVILDSKDNIIVLGNESRISNYLKYGFLTKSTFFKKYNANGKKIWSEMIKSDYKCEINSIVLDSLDNMFVAGYLVDSAKFNWRIKYKYDGGSNNSFIAKLSSDGKWQEARVYRSEWQDSVTNLLLIEDELYVIGIYSGDFKTEKNVINHHGEGSYYMLKLDMNFNEIDIIDFDYVDPRIFSVNDMFNPLSLYRIVDVQNNIDFIGPLYDSLDQKSIFIVDRNLNTTEKKIAVNEFSAGSFNDYKYIYDDSYIYAIPTVLNNIIYSIKLKQNMRTKKIFQQNNHLYVLQEAIYYKNNQPEYILSIYSP